MYLKFYEVDADEVNNNDFDVAARDVDVANLDIANGGDDVNTKTIDNNVNKGFY